MAELRTAVLVQLAGEARGERLAVLDEHAPAMVWLLIHHTAYRIKTLCVCVYATLAAVLGEHAPHAVRRVHRR